MNRLRILAAIATIAPALAHAESYVDSYERVQNPAYYNTQVGRLVSLEIYDRTTNQTLPIYRRNGKHYIAGEANHEYQINIINQTRSSAPGQRKLAVLSVDGVNVISGDTAGYQQSGYVLEPGQLGQIKGWRKNMNEVAKFYFTYPDNSYASRTGRPQNTGVIGMAVFNEKYVPPPVAEPDISNFSSADRSVSSRAREALGAAPAAAPMAKSELGTGHGSRETSRTSSTEFERASSSPNETIVVYYDTREHLIELGIIPPPKPEPKANPFPQGNMRFAPDPR